MDKRTLQRLRVPLGFLFAIVFLIFAKPTAFSLMIGSAIAIIGVAIRAWASGHIRKASVLAVTGPYAYTRNPLYVGSFIMGLGFTIAAGRALLVLIFIIMILGIYLPVMRVESQTLSELFGKKYQRYANEVPLFWPRFSPYRQNEVEFDRNLYLRYREYRAAVGTVIAWALLAVKAIYFK